MNYPECKFRREVSPGFNWCDNPKVVCGAPFPVSMCEHCTLAETESPLDFLALTNKLKSSPFMATRVPMSAAEPEPADKVNCKPCQKKANRRKKRSKIAPVFRERERVIQRRPDMDGNTVVWVYWNSGAVSDEMKWSMASVMKNLSGASNLVICGDRPKWWKGEYISCPRVKREDVTKTFGSGRFTKWVDSVMKLWAIIESPLVTENFLWMYDDTFVLTPYTFDQIAVPVADNRLHASQIPESHSWHEVRRRTANSLAARGLPVWNYSTHHPAVYSKSKLVQTIQEFDLPQSPRLIESLYLNHHYPQPGARSNPVFQYRKRVRNSFQPRNVPILNVGQFNEAVRSALVARVPGILDAVKELENG